MWELFTDKYSTVYTVFTPFKVTLQEYFMQAVQQITEE